jgi:hypothetical protein
MTGEAVGDEVALRDRISALLNEYSRENRSDTPDFILADFLVGALRVFDDAVSRRERWYGRSVG